MNVSKMLSEAIAAEVREPIRFRSCDPALDCDGYIAKFERRAPGEDRLWFDMEIAWDAIERAISSADPGPPTGAQVEAAITSALGGDAAFASPQFRRDEIVAAALRRFARDVIVPEVLRAYLRHDSEARRKPAT